MPLKTIVKKMGDSLLQRVPKIRMMSQKDDEYLTRNEPKFYWDLDGSVSSSTAR